MNYEFPIINNIDDVLPHIAAYDEIIVAEREHFDVINYIVVKPTTFEMDGSDDLGAAIRRECRGLMFDKQGNLISRPFHKFFNIGEREETSIENVNAKFELDPLLFNGTDNCIIMEKLDGSMLRPLKIDGEIRWATKMGFSDVALQAQEFWDNNATKPLYNYINDCLDFGTTPLFEFTSPDNKIVIGYDETQIRILGCRINETGEYLYPKKGSKHPFQKCLTTHHNLINIQDRVSHVRARTDSEGEVIQFVDGHMVKVKSDWYSRIHRIKDKIRDDRHIVQCIMENEIDDVYPILDPDDVYKLKAFEKNFWKAYHLFLEDILTITAESLKYDTRKSLAVDFVSNLKDKRVAAFVFGSRDGKDVNEMLLNYVKCNMKKTKPFEEMREWMQF